MKYVDIFWVGLVNILCRQSWSPEALKHEATVCGFQGKSLQQLLNLANTFMNYTDFSDSLSVHLVASSGQIFTLSNTMIYLLKNLLN